MGSLDKTLPEVLQCSYMKYVERFEVCTHNVGFYIAIWMSTLCYRSNLSSLCVSLSVSLSLSLPVSLCLSVSLSPCLSLSLCPSWRQPWDCPLPRLGWTSAPTPTAANQVAAAPPSPSATPPSPSTSGTPPWCPSRHLQRPAAAAMPGRACTSPAPPTQRTPASMGERVWTATWDTGTASATSTG